MKLLVLSIILTVFEQIHALNEQTPQDDHSTLSGRSLQYANHIFNAIHSSMRQWGSSLNHNGMTAFVATVPAGTEFYHGTSSAQRVNGTEWLAFEPEHALLFAAWSTPPMDGDRLTSARSISRRSHDGHPLDGRDDLVDVVKEKREQVPMREHNGSGDERPAKGYLHTYRTNGALRLLYVDGQSAAKSRKGTLDLQDLVILQNRLDSVQPPHHPGSGPMHERERAEGLCRIAHEQWHDRIDGILRMEGGFEIILCSFERHLDLVSINQVKLNGPPRANARPPPTSNSVFPYHKAVASRYDGIGGERVKIDYSNFVSLFAYPDAFYFDEAGLPRALNGSETLDVVREDIDQIANKGNAREDKDWQAVADMVVARYADVIEYLASCKLNTVADLQAEIEMILRPFIDFGHRNEDAEVNRCTSQFLPRLDANEQAFAASVIRTVSGTICSKLSHASRMKSAKDMLASLQELRTWLGWTVWKKCKGCAANEVCFVPIWPVGTREDFETPTCRSNFSWGPGHGNYWGHDRPGGQFERADLV